MKNVILIKTLNKKNLYQIWFFVRLKVFGDSIHPSESTQVKKWLNWMWNSQKQVFLMFDTVRDSH